MDVRTIGRGEGHNVGNVLYTSGRGVGIGLDRERVDVVVDDVDKIPACVTSLPLSTRCPLQQVQLEHRNNTFAVNKSVRMVEMWKVGNGVDR